MLKDNKLNNVSATELCKTAVIDHSTFYTNYEDVSALANEVAAKIERRLEEQRRSGGEFAWTFEHIKSNKDVFEACVK